MCQRIWELFTEGGLVPDPGFPEQGTKWVDPDPTLRPVCCGWLWKGELLLLPLSCGCPSILVILISYTAFCSRALAQLYLPVTHWDKLILWAAWRHGQTATQCPVSVL